MSVIDVILYDRNYNARGKYNILTKQVIVLKGSQFKTSHRKSFESSPRYTERDKMVNNPNILNNFILQCDYAFPSLSYALGVISGSRGTRGLIEWKVSDGRSVREYLEG